MLLRDIKFKMVWDCLNLIAKAWQGAKTKLWKKVMTTMCTWQQFDDPINFLEVNREDAKQLVNNLDKELIIELQDLHLEMRQMKILFQLGRERQRIIFLSFEIKNILCMWGNVQGFVKNQPKHHSCNLFNDNFFQIKKKLGLRHLVGNRPTYPALVPKEK